MKILYGKQACDNLYSWHCFCELTLRSTLRRRRERQQAFREGVSSCQSITLLGSYSSPITSFASYRSHLPLPCSLLELYTHGWNRSRKQRSRSIRFCNTYTGTKLQPAKLLFRTRLYCFHRNAVRRVRPLGRYSSFPTAKLSRRGKVLHRCWSARSR